MNDAQMTKLQLLQEVRRLRLELSEAGSRVPGKEAVATDKRYRGVFESLNRAVVVYRAEKDGNDFVFVDLNRAVEETENVRREDLIGRSVLEVFPGVRDLGLFEVLQRVWRTGRTEFLPIKLYKDHRISGWRENTVFKLPSGEIAAAYGDESERKRLEDIVRQQTEEIMELSTPVVRVWEGLVVAPLVGVVDSRRAQNFMERFLDGIVHNRASVALVDITGVPMVDTQTAQHLIESFTAARLLGTRVILTGVSPTIAQTLVHLGIDLAEIETCSSLSTGLATGLKVLGLEMARTHRGD